MNARRTLMTGIVLCMLVVILGAFGAHGLKNMVSARMLEVYQTGILYQMFHSIAILAVGLIGMLSLRAEHEMFISTKHLKLSYHFFLLGIILFCGSLYGLALSEAITGNRLVFLGMITPIGGLSFIAGWLCMFLSLWKRK